MPICMPTADEWEAYFPERIKDKSSQTTPFGTFHDANELMNARFAEVAITVTVMLAKNWVYDPTDFFDILEEARRLQYPEKDENWLNELAMEDVYATLSSGHHPFFPSRMTGGNRVYIVSNTKKEQKRAFAEFLENEGYSFTH